jgi:hypothetical protein
VDSRTIALQLAKAFREPSQDRQSDTAALERLDGVAPESAAAINEPFGPEGGELVVALLGMGLVAWIQRAAAMD